MKISQFLSENFRFLDVKFSIYLNRRVFVMRPSRISGRGIMTVEMISWTIPAEVIGPSWDLNLRMKRHRTRCLIRVNMSATHLVILHTFTGRKIDILKRSIW